MQTHDVVAHQDEEQRLYQWDTSHIDDLRPDITAVWQMQETLALQQGTILDDFLRTAAHADECGDDDSHEEIADEVLIVHHRIAFGWRIAG